MRNESLNAYSLHQRPFQEKRAIYYLLTKEHGIVHGIAKKGIPQFVPLTLFATGKKELKTFQQVNIADIVPNLVGQQQYAALYINEITFKLLPTEDSIPTLFESYAKVITRLQYPLSSENLKLSLRIYEQALFAELGIAIDFEQDGEQKPIKSESDYRFVANNGWELAIVSTDSSSSFNPSSSAILYQETIRGHAIIAMRSGIDLATLSFYSIIHRQIIDYLFDYQPLQSRILWQQYMRYQ